MREGRGKGGKGRGGEREVEELFNDSSFPSR